MAAKDSGKDRTEKGKQSLGFAITAAVAGTPAAEAQERSLEEIIVTATKREVSLQSVPIAVTAFSEEEITFQRFKNFADYVGQIPSLSVSDRQPGAQSVVMRGCAAQGLSFSDSATTSVYLDEQPITYSGFNPDPRLIDIERVEALAGPQGSLFGDAAQCGTLRIITNKPDTTQGFGWVDLTGSTVTDGDSGYDVSAMANIPLIRDTVALRLVGFYADEPGFIDNVLSPTPGQQFDNADQVREDVNSSVWQGARGMLRITPSENLTIDVGAIYQKYELDGFGDVSLNQQFYSDTSVFPVFGERDQARFVDEYWEDEWYQVSLTVEADLDFGNLVFTGAYFDRETAYVADGSAYHQSYQQLGDYLRSMNTGDPYYDVGGIYDFGGDPLATNEDYRDITTWALEARYSTPSEGRWSAIVGGFYSHREMNELYAANSFRDFAFTYGFYYLNYAGYIYYEVPLKGVTNNWFSGVYNQELDQWAIFGEVTFDITENFTITAGGRYFDIENNWFVQNATLVGVNGGIPDCGNVLRDEQGQIIDSGDGVDYCFGLNDAGIGTESGFVPKVNLTYRVDDDKLVYATYSEGFRRGGANSARPQSVFGPPGRFPPPAGSLSTYESDTVKNYEIGAKTDWVDGRLRLNVAAYQLIWDDIQVQAEDPQDDNFVLGIVNFPEAEITGFEAWFSWLPSDAWNFDATLGYNDGELSETAVLFEGTGSEIVAPEGTPLPIVPDWKASVNVTYTIPQTWFGGEPYLFGRFAHTGESINSLAGIESNDFASPISIQDSYQTLDLQIGLDHENWSLSLFVDNVTDEQGQVFFNNRFNQQRLSIIRPRTFGINYRYVFGAR